jgi:hypothetical protein
MTLDPILGIKKARGQLEEFKERSPSEVLSPSQESSTRFKRQPDTLFSPFKQSM